MNDRDAGQSQVFLDDSNGPRDLRRVGAFALHAEQLITATKYEVDLRTLVCSPKERLIMRLGCQDLLDHEALPRGADLGVGEELLEDSDAQQLMEEPGISKIDLGRLHLSLSEIRVKGSELTDHERVGQ